jgi:hypothetical protein
MNSLPPVPRHQVLHRRLSNTELQKEGKLILAIYNYVIQNEVRFDF